MQIAEDIHWVEGTQGCNVYLLVGGGRAWTVDTGFLGAFGYVAAYLRYLGLAPQVLERVLLTHSHAAHAAIARRLKAWSGAAIAGAPPARVRWTAMVPVVDETLADGAILDSPLGELRVLGCPGHSPDSLAFWLPERRVLLVGDALFGDRGRLTRPFLRVDQVSAHEESLRRLTDLPAEVVLPGHGSPVLARGQEALREAIAQPPRPVTIGGVLRARRQLRAMVTGILLGSWAR